MGQFLNGKMHGYGEFYWSDGKKYVGNYQEDQKNGFGVFFWSINPVKVFIGSWKDGVQNGLGLILTPSKICYGLWNKAKKVLSFKGLWDMKRYAKENNLKYNSVFEKNPKDVLNFCENI